MTYYVLKLSDRRLVALPSLDSETVAMSTLGLTSHTTKRRLFKTAVKALLITEAFRRRFEAIDSPLLDDYDGTLWEAVLPALRGLIGSIDRHVIYFPSQPDRKRAYVYAAGIADNKDTFAKIEYGTEKKLQNELNFIELMKHADVTFSVPEIVGSTFEKSFSILALRVIPAEFSHKARPWDAQPFLLRNEILGPVRTRPIKELQWWRNCSSVPGNGHRPFQAKVVEIAQCPQPVGRAHGDFSSSNIFYAGGKVIVGDWESASPEAPFMLDEVSYRMSLIQPLIHRNPQKAFTRIVESITTGYDCDLATQRVDSLFLSLAYLNLTNRLEAKLLTASLREHQIAGAYELSR
jgi:hypothetical protein